MHLVSVSLSQGGKRVGVCDSAATRVGDSVCIVLFEGIEVQVVSSKAHVREDVADHRVECLRVSKSQSLIVIKIELAIQGGNPATQVKNGKR